MSFGCGLVYRTRRIPSIAADVGQQIGEQRAQADRLVAGLPGRELEVAAVAVDVLAEQGHLGHAVGGELRDLGEHVGERSTDLHTAHGRDDAEGAVVVAADLDGDPGVVRRLAAGRQRRGEHRLVVDDRLLQDLGDRRLGVRACSSRSAARCTLWVPITTSTWPARFGDRGPGPSGPGTRRRRSGDLRARPFQVLRWPRLP